MSVSEAHQKAIEDAVQAQFQPEAEPDRADEEVTHEDIESTGESTAQDEAGDSALEDRQEQGESGEDTLETGEAASEDHGEDPEAGEAGEDAHRPPEAVEDEQPLIAFKNQEELKTFLDMMRKQQDDEQPERKEEVPKEEDPLAELPDLDPEVYDDNVIKMFNGMKSVMKQQQETLREYRQQQEQLSQSVQHNVQADVEKQFDNAVAALGDDFNDALGTGRMADLSPESSQYKQRDAVAGKMAVLAAGYRAIGNDVPPFDDLFQEAVNAVLAGTYVEAHQQKLSTALKAQERKQLQRPGGSKNKKKGTPAEETAAFIREKYGDRFQEDGW